MAIPDPSISAIRPRHALRRTFGCTIRGRSTAKGKPDADCVDDLMKRVRGAVCLLRPSDPLTSFASLPTGV